MAAKGQNETGDYRVSKSEYQESEYPFYDVVDYALEFVWAPEIDTYENRKDRFDRLTPGTKVILPLVQLDGDVCNGGFQQYFFNSYADFAIEALRGLERIGATPYASLLSSAFKIFPSGKPPRERTQRWETLMAGIKSRIDKAKAATDGESMIDAYWIDPKLAAQLDELSDPWYELNDSDASLPNVLGPQFIEKNKADFVK